MPTLPKKVRGGKTYRGNGDAGKDHGNKTRVENPKAEINLGGKDLKRKRPS